MSIIGNTKNSDASIFGSWDPNSSDGGGGNGTVTNPLTGDLDLGGFQLVNTSNIMTLPIDGDLDMENHNITHINQLRFNDGTKITEAGDELTFVDSGSTERRILLQGGLYYSLDGLDLGGNDLTNTRDVIASRNISGLNYTVNTNGSVNFGNSRSVHLYSNNTDLAIGSANDIILTSANISNYVVNHENVDTIVFNDQTLANTTKTLSLSSNKLFLNNSVLATIDESDTLRGAENIEFEGSGTLTATSNHMIFNSHVVIDESNIDSYVEAVEIPNMIKCYVVESALINEGMNAIDHVYDIPVDFSDKIDKTGQTTGYGVLIYGRLIAIAMNSTVQGVSTFKFNLSGYRNISVNNLNVINHTIESESDTLGDQSDISSGVGDGFQISYNYQINLKYKIKVEYSISYVVY